MGAVVSRITKLLAAVSFVALPALDTGAAEKTLSWGHEACDYSVTFDPGKYDEARLRNTAHLLYGPPDFKAPSVGLPFNPQSIARLNLEHTQRECRSALDVASRLEFIALPGIDDYRRALMDEIKDTCEFETTEIRGFQKPSALRDYQPAAVCSPFVDALEGKRDIMAAFRQTVSQRCSGADQAECIERENARAQKDDGNDWVRLYLVKFGWNSCASQFTRRNVDSRKLELMRAGLEEQFQQTFKITKNRCEAVANAQPELRFAPAPLADAIPDKAASTGGKAAVSSTDRPHVLRCSNPTETVRWRRSEPERALCAAAHTDYRSASLPTPFFAADRSKQALTYGRR
jgi:hypothetical protein